MKLSAYHKGQGDSVEWYDTLGGHYDVVYQSKVFSFSQDFQYFIDADKVVKGGTGYAIQLIDGKEKYNKDLDHNLPVEVELMYPDTSIYKGRIKDVENTAYGFLTRGCPRNCAFCHVSDKEGTKSHKVAELHEFWTDEKYIEILDPNILACKDREELLLALAFSNAKVNFNQGLDARFLDEYTCKILADIDFSMVHFAWDNYEDGEMILPKIKMFSKITGINPRNLIVYVLTNFGTTKEQDLERIYKITEAGASPYVMIYDKEHLPAKHELKRIQRWCNNRFIFRACPNYADYKG